MEAMSQLLSAPISLPHPHSNGTMSTVLDFIARHRYLLWIPLGTAGILSILQVTLFYRMWLRFTAWLLWRFRRLPDIFAKMNTPDEAIEFILLFWKGIHRWFRLNYRRGWIRIAAVMQGVILVTAAVTLALIRTAE